MKLSKLTEAKYAGPKMYVVNAFDPEEGLLDVYAGPFNRKKEAEQYASDLDSTIKQMIEKAGGDNEFGRFVWDELPRFDVIEVDSPDSFKNEWLHTIQTQYLN